MKTVDEERLKELGERTRQDSPVPMQGACVACGACIRGKSNIIFASKRKVSA